MICVQHVAHIPMKQIYQRNIWNERRLHFPDHPKQNLSAQPWEPSFVKLVSKLCRYHVEVMLKSCGGHVWIALGVKFGSVSAPIGGQESLLESEVQMRLSRAGAGEIDSEIFPESGLPNAFCNRSNARQRARYLKRSNRHGISPDLIAGIIYLVPSAKQWHILALGDQCRAKPCAR